MPRFRSGGTGAGGNAPGGAALLASGGITARTPEMIKTVVAVLAISVGLTGVATAQTVRAPVPANPAGVLLVKHDKEDNGRGRKLGHYKQRGNDDENDSGDRGRRSSTRSRTNNYYAPYYNGAPGYGGSYRAPSYDYYQPSYYRGY